MAAKPGDIWIVCAMFSQPASTFMAKVPTPATFPANSSCLLRSASARSVCLRSVTSKLTPSTRRGRPSALNAMKLRELDPSNLAFGTQYPVFDVIFPAALTKGLLSHLLYPDEVISVNPGSPMAARGFLRPLCRLSGRNRDLATGLNKACERPAFEAIHCKSCCSGLAKASISFNMFLLGASSTITSTQQILEICLSTPLRVP